MRTANRRRVAVIGAGQASAEELALAARVGTEIARRDAILVCGGLGGVMDAAARAARDRGGTSIGFLPGYDASQASAGITIPLPTGLGHARNVLVVAGAEAVIAIGGGAGTLSEIGLALKLGRRVVGLGTWKLEAPGGSEVGMLTARDALEAVSLALGEQEVER